MRLPEHAIKAAVLHGEGECRAAAVSFFSGSFSPDDTVMPLVIQAIERYGRDAAQRLLAGAQRLAQTRDTVDWLCGELRRPYDFRDPSDDNYRFAIALVLYHTPIELLLDRAAEIASLSAFPEQLHGPLAERLEMRSWDWDRGWTALEGLGQDVLAQGRFTRSAVRRVDHLLESLARHRATHADTVIGLLQPSEGCDAALDEWLRPQIVRLAGAMRLESAVPLLVPRLTDPQITVADEAATALIALNTDDVVAAIVAAWPSAGPDFRAAAADVLEHVHSDYAAATCLTLFSDEPDPPTKLWLAHAVLSQFLEEGIEPVRQFVLEHGPQASPNHLDAQYRLVTACTIMGRRFPEFDEWHARAVADHWGLGDYQPLRLADSFRPE